MSGMASLSSMCGRDWKGLLHSGKGGVGADARINDPLLFSVFFRLYLRTNAPESVLTLGILRRYEELGIDFTQEEISVCLLPKASS